VYVYGWVCGVVWYQDITKTLHWNDMKLGPIVVLDTMSKPIDFEFKKTRVQGQHFELLAPAAT